MAEALIPPKKRVKLQTRTITPTAEGQTVTPDTGYTGLSAVVLEAVELGGDLQDKVVTPTAEGLTVTPDEGYGGLSSVDVEGDSNLSPENIAADVTIFGVTGTMRPGATSVLPDEYESYVATAATLYGSDDYTNVFVAETDGYITVGLLMDDFALTAYNTETTEFSASGWYRAAYNKTANSWASGDYTSTASSGGNFTRNIRYATTALTYNGAQAYPPPDPGGVFDGGGTGGGSTGSDVRFVVGNLSYPIVDWVVVTDTLDIETDIIFVEAYA